LSRSRSFTLKSGAAYRVTGMELRGKLMCIAAQ
jgi:hypothetical protein